MLLHYPLRARGHFAIRGRCSLVLHDVSRAVPKRHATLHADALSPSLPIFDFASFARITASISLSC